MSSRNPEMRENREETFDGADRGDIEREYRHLIADSEGDPPLQKFWRASRWMYRRSCARGKTAFGAAKRREFPRPDNPWPNSGGAD